LEFRVEKGEKLETLKAISQRTSLKGSLSGRDVEREKIEKLLEAASLAPSARNQQPWRFIVVQGKKNVEDVVNKAFMGMNQIVKDAPVLILACANPSDDDIHEGREYYLFDVGLAVENMLLAATDLGLVTHPMTAVHEEELKKLLHIPSEVRFVAATPLAYPAQASYEKAAQERLGQRTRKSVSEIAYSNEWGKPF
jgi:nitroreductase